MARKSIKGYSEKNYYDNTKFSGITATHDILNEGAFRHMSNLDISDTGRSVTPRKGYLTTEFVDADDNPIVLTDSTIYFQEPNTGEYIFIDMCGMDLSMDDSIETSIPMFCTNFSIDNNKITTTAIPYINVDDLLTYLNITISDLINLKPVGSNFAEIMYNEYGVKQNVIKVQYLEQQFWINLVYNKSEDTLYITPVYTNDPVAVDTTNRNIASNESIIPDPIYSVYGNGKAPIGHYNHIPMIYAKQNGKYLINTANTLSGLELKPSFFIEDFDSTYEWAYTYDIRSTSTLSTKTYKSPVYKLENHSRYSDLNLFTVSNDILGDIGFSINMTEESELLSAISNLAWSKNKWLTSSHMQQKFIVYVIPGDTGTAGSFNLSKDLFENITVEATNNEFVILNKLYTLHKDTCATATIDLSAVSNYSTSAGLYNYLKDKNIKVFVQRVHDVKDYSFSPSSSYLYNFSSTALYSNIMVFPNSLLTVQEFKTKYLDAITEGATYYFKPFNHLSKFKIEKNLFLTSTWGDSYIEGMDTTNGLIVRDYMNTYFPIDNYDSYMYLCTTDLTDIFSDYIFTIFSDSVPTSLSFPRPYSYSNTDYYSNINYGVNNIFDSSLFTNYFTLTYDTSNEVIQRLKDNLFFENGFDITFYLLRRPLEIPEGMNYDIYGRELLISSSSLYQSRTVILDNNEVIYIPEHLKEEPMAIASATNSLVFRDTLGDHLVVWNNNQVFISEPSTYYYFKYTGMFSYPAKVIKVIQYKDTLLVFTAQDLYSIFPYESTIQVQDGTDDEGNPKYVQSKVITYNTLPVLYNLMVDEQYADAIQVFNQMVLFYSADGQMFMIKPTATIDSNTRFSIQYFNKSANDILANYHEYINERLQEYNIDKVVTKDDVVIKVLVNINYIKIFYCVPDVITYILIYDVINNYYTVYDTVAYSHVTDFINHEGFELYCTKHKDRMYITFPYRDVYHTDNNTDISSYYNFSPFEIHAELDTGNINLNNHIKKRFRTLYNTYKNIDAHELIYTVESFVDDVPVLTRVQDTIEIKNIDGVATYTPAEISNAVNLLADNSALFDFSAYNMNKIINHRSNVICSGKSIRLRLRFTSKGKYKILGYGLIYKEHHV